MNLTIKISTGENFEVTVDGPDVTVLELKEACAAAKEIPVEQQRLIFGGHVLRDPRTLQSYSIEDGYAVHLVRGTARPATTRSPPPAAAASSGPIPGMGGGGMGGMNPEFMRNLLNNPAISSVLDNPETFRSMLSANPRMRALMESNPEIASVLNDPAQIREMMRIMRNPTLMREMMRTTDLQLGNIEAHPEGFNALRRMYETLHEPLTEALAGAGRGETSSSDRPETPAATAEPNSTPMANPWARSAPSAGAGGAPFNPFGAMGGMGGMGGMGAGGMPGVSPEMMESMLSNPAVQRMMESMMANPELMRSMMASNPMFQNLPPHMRSMMENPEFLRQMANPETLRSIMQLQSAFGGMGGMGGGTSPGAAGAGSGTPGTASAAGAGGGMGGLDLGALLGSLGAGGAAGAGGAPDLGSLLSGLRGAAPAPSTPGAAPDYADIYRIQLQQLHEMGFTDDVRNISVLRETGGNVEATLDRLLRS